MSRVLTVCGVVCALLALFAASTATAASKPVVQYHVDSNWGSGFQATLTLRNKTPKAISNWQLEFDFPHSVSSIWDASIVSHTGKHYTIRGANWNANLAAHGMTNFGLVAQTVGKVSKPKHCKLNGIGIKCKNITNATPQPTVTKTPKATAQPSRTATTRPTRTMTPITGPSPTPGTAPNFPARVFAPYVDVLMWPTAKVSEIAQQTGGKYYTLAFIISSNGCTASWGGVIPLADNFYADEIAALRKKGGDVIVSFGGANGTELGQACSTVAALQAQYQQVIDRYGLTHIDLDIEGAAIADSNSVDRRNKAIAGLQAAAKAKGKALDVSYTLPVLPTGLTWEGVNLLQNAVQNGVQVSTVNIMAMDYGGPAVADPHKMGDAAIQAATSLHGQLKSLYAGKSDAALWRTVGVTPMIGLNDVHPEVFTVADAQKLVAFAKNKNISRLAFWSVGRDRSCPNNGAYVASDCSGIVQQPWEFTKAFRTFTE